MGVEVFFDGACEPINPGGIATYGYLIYKDGQEQARGCGEITRGAQATNNYAEYYALLIALMDTYVKFPAESIKVYGDSQLVINQMAGKWQMRAQNLRPLFEQAQKIVSLFSAVEWQWIKREENYLADGLSRKAYIRASKE